MQRRLMRSAILLAVTMILMVQTGFAEDEKQTIDKEATVLEQMQALHEAIESLRRENKANKDHIASLEAEIRRLQEGRIDLQRSLGEEEISPLGEDPELDALLEDLGLGDEEDDLDSILGDLTSDGSDSEQDLASSLGSSAAQVFQSMNPDISVIGDFLGHYTSQEGGEFDDEFRFSELELSFSTSVDPYARADIYVSFGQDTNGDWETDLEEGYVTFIDFPCDLQPRVGKFKTSFGKANSVHPHALPWVEYPLVIQHFFGEAGLAGDGAGVAWLVPNPWDNYMELTYEITNNDNDIFAGNQSDDFMNLLHFKNFIDLSDSSTVEMGLSYATAPNNDKRGSYRTHVEGVDLTYKWRPPSSGLYESFLWQTEVLCMQAEHPTEDERAHGMYSAMNYQFARRWTAGVRYDHTEMPDDSSRREAGYATYLTFIQSEFLYWRLAYRYTDRNFIRFDDKEEHEVFLQLNFGIGPHRAHKY